MSSVSVGTVWDVGIPLRIDSHMLELVAPDVVSRSVEENEESVSNRSVLDRHKTLRGFQKFGLCARRY